MTTRRQACWIELSITIFKIWPQCLYAYEYTTAIIISFFMWWRCSTAAGGGCHRSNRRFIYFLVLRILKNCFKIKRILREVVYKSRAKLVHVQTLGDGGSAAGRRLSMKKEFRRIIWRLLSVYTKFQPFKWIISVRNRCFAWARSYAHTVCVGSKLCAYRNEICVPVPSYRHTSCVGNKGVRISNTQLTSVPFFPHSGFSYTVKMEFSDGYHNQ